MSSVSRGAGRFEAGTVWKSTAAYSAVWPTLSSMFTSAPRSMSSAATSNCPLVSARISDVWRSGSTMLMSAPASRSDPGAGDLAVARREEQRRQPARRQPLVARLLRALPLPDDDRRARVDVGAGFDQHPHRVDVAFGGRPHQRRLAAPVLDRVDTRAVGQQDANGIGLSGPGAQMEGRFAERAGGVGADAGLEQTLDHRCAAVFARQRDRRDAVAVLGLGVRAGANQPIHERRRRRSARPSAAPWCRRLPAR